MLGVVLLFVGIVLISNGIGRLYNVDTKSMSIINFFVGVVTFILNIILIVKGEYYAGATGLLFSFTYLYIALNGLFSLNLIPYAWYSLFVTINTIPIGIITWHQDWRMAVIWWLWGILWSTAWIEIVLKKNLGAFVPALAIIEGIITAWIPGFLLLINKW